MTPFDVDEAQARLGRDLDAAAEGVPGIGERHVGILATSTIAIVRTAFRGWSPTLHSVRISREKRLPLTIGGKAIDLESFLERHGGDDDLVEHQRARAASAFSLGATKPLSLKEISHIHIDRDMPALRGDGAEKTRKAVHEAVRRTHTEARDYAGGPIMRASGVMLAESLQDDGEWLRVAAVNVKIPAPDGGRMAKLTGFNIEVETDHLPETLMNALVGRRVGDMASVHPQLDQRIIRSITNRTSKVRPGIIVGIDLEVDPIDEVIAAAA